MDRQAEFHAWLARNGAQLQPSTNPYEYARFVAHGGVPVVYTNKVGKVTAAGHAGKAFSAWLNGKPWNAGLAKHARTKNSKIKAALVERDGMDCFYCRKPLGDDITVEHLVSLDKGGPNHMDNFALVHAACNREADNLPLVEKIKIRERVDG